MPAGRRCAGRSLDSEAGARGPPAHVSVGDLSTRTPRRRSSAAAAVSARALPCLSSDVPPLMGPQDSSGAGGARGGTARTHRHNRMQRGSTHPVIGSARGCTSRRTRPRRRPRRDPDAPARAPARDGPERTVPPSWGRWRHCAARQRPGTARSASSAWKVTAVRIDVRIRHTQRPQPQLTPAGGVSAAGAVGAQDAQSRAETGAWAGSTAPVSPVVDPTWSSPSVSL